MSFDLLKRIANHLIINASYLNNLGLYHGKMGIVLFFVHYARYTGDLLYDDFARKLINEIYDEIRDDIPINFENGLCGIGWGIEYLLEYGFMNGKSEEILADIDLKIMERNLRRVTDLSLKTGVLGIICYGSKHINSRSNKSGKLPFDSEYLSDFMCLKQYNIPNDNMILLNIASEFIVKDNAREWLLGLENGCAGYGLKSMLK
ncbi:MAG: hypothetical protein PHO36_05170 [Parabacteroides sp.]|nr:hypothetical protein [Parabacteroides sp.]